MTIGSAFALLLLPVITGLSSVLWSQLAAVSRADTALLNVVVYALLYLSLRWFGAETSDLATTIRVVGVAKVGVYVAINVAISVAWFVALKGSHVVVVGLAEIAYPVFVLAFSFVLIGPLRLHPVCWLGAVLLFAGCALVVWGSAAGAAPMLDAAPLFDQGRS